MTPDTSTARVERVLDGELCEDHGQIVASDCFACELVKARRATKHLIRDCARLESALLTERGKLEAADAANDALQVQSEARADLLREAADDCDECANDLLNQAPIMGPTKEARYRKQAAACVERGAALRAWADEMDAAMKGRA